MNMKKIAAIAAAAVMAAGICAGVPAGTENSSLFAVTAEAADNGFVIETDENGDKYVSGYTGNGGDITIPDGVKYIGNLAFGGNSNITSVTFPKSCTIIENEAFVASSIKKLVFKGDAITKLHSFWSSEKLESVVINGNASFGKNSFEFCSKLKSITINGSIKPTDDCCGIEEYAFMSCESLKTVKILKNNYEFKIADGAFQNCFSLNSINLPNKCTEIAAYAFLSCYDLKKITIPAKTKLNDYSIGYCAIINGNKIDTYVADGKSSGYNSFHQDIPVTPIITCTVTKGSPAEKYCKENGIIYVYADGSLVDTTATKSTSAPAASTGKKLAAPTGIKGTASSDKIVLTWNKVDGAEGYRIYKYDEKTGKYLKYKDVKNEKCTVKGLKASTKYKFKIYALVSEKGEFAVQTPTNAFSFTTKAAKKAAEPFDDTLITL